MDRRARHSFRSNRRSALLTLAGLGALVCLVGGSVLYSALQDTARTGTNSAESAALAASADIQLATATFTVGEPIACGAFSEDSTSAFLSVTDVSPGFGSGPRQFCIKNVGSQPVTLSALADELADTDFACTGDETVHGDTTCGANQLGELSGVLSLFYNRVDCQTAASVGPSGALTLNENATTPVALGVLGTSVTACFATAINYPSDTAPAGVQTAQSDRATWRYKFTAQA